MNHTKKRYYYPPLDGLRGTAVVMVLLFHLFEYVSIFQGNWISVDLFFAISGFLITGILLRHGNEPRSLKTFYIRRGLRILPMYYLSLLVIVFFLPQAITRSFNMQYFRDNQWWLWLYVQNWLFILKNPGRNVLLNHFWTLSVEEQFYIFWPLVVLLIKRPKYLAIFIGSLFLLNIGCRVFVWRLQLPGIDYNNLFKFTRIDGLCAGSGLAVAAHYRLDLVRKYIPKLLLGMVVFNLLFLLIKYTAYKQLPYWGFIGYPTVGICWGLIIYKSVFAPNRITNIAFTNPVMLYFGRISYSLYLLHWPMYMLGGPFVHDLLSNYLSLTGMWNTFIVSVVSLAASIVAGNLCYHFIERYFMGLKISLAPYSSAPDH